MASLVTPHRAMPSRDKIPQVMSNFVIFHWALLLKNAAKKTNSGFRPTERVIIEAQPTPLEISAEKATSGAIAQKSQDTLLGLTVPLRVAITYFRSPKVLRSKDKITKRSSSILLILADQ